MLREIFFGKENAQLTTNTNLVDAEPVRSTSLAACWFPSSASAFIHAS